MNDKNPVITANEQRSCECGIITEGAGGFCTPCSQEQIHSAPRSKKLMSLLRHFSPIAIFIILTAAIRLLVAPTFGLGVDEAHYVLYGKYLDFSYFDHPPLVGFTHALFLHFGDSEFWARVPAILLGALTTFLAYSLLLEISKSQKIALFGAVALNCSPMINAIFMMLLPDSFLLPIAFLLIFLVRKIESDGAPKYWLLGGLLLGVAGLAKYSSFLFVVAIIAYFLVKKRFDILLNPKIVPTALVALATVSPVIYWNYLHDFASFKYQSDHVVGSTFDFISFLKSLAAQFGAYSPLLFILAVWGFAKSLKVDEPLIKIALFLGGGVALFFIYTSFSKVVLPHWSALFYALFIPLSIFLLWDRQRLLYYFVGISGAITLFLYVELAFKNIPSLHRDIYGWDKIMQEANSKLEAHKNANLAVPNWTLGSRALYYNKSNSKLFVIDSRIDQFDFWEGESPKGKDLLFIIPKSSKFEIEKKAKCAKIEPNGEMRIVVRDSLIDRVSFVMCYGFDGVR